MSAQMINPQMLQLYYAQLVQKISTETRELLDQNSNGALPTDPGSPDDIEKSTQSGKKSNFSMASILGEDSDGAKTISVDSSESDSEQIVPTAVRMSPDPFQNRLTNYYDPEQIQRLIKPRANIGGPHLVPTYPPIPSMWGFFGGPPAQQNQNHFATKSKRNRTIFTQKQIERLEIEFGKSQYMIGADRVQLAKDLNLSETQVKVWFQNRRIKSRKSQKEQPKT